MRTSVLVLATILAAIGSSCARGVPRSPTAAPGTPHVTWILMYGDRDNADEEFACQSGPAIDCVIPASRAGAQVFSDIHVYYHGAGAETRYEGTVNIGYVQGSPDSYTARTNITVKKNESIANQGVVGIVKGAPGVYAVKFALTATVAGGKTVPIDETVQVTLR